MKGGRTNEGMEAAVADDKQGIVSVAALPYLFLQALYIPLYAAIVPFYSHVFPICHRSHSQIWPLQRIVAGHKKNTPLSSLGRQRI